MPLPSQKPPRASKHCRHYTYRHAGLDGIRRGDLGGPACARGIPLGEPRATNACMPEPVGSTCSQREEYTEAERQAWAAWKDEGMARMVVVMAAIPGSASKADRATWGTSGSFTCPACEVGTVRWTRAGSNGHLHAACSTPNCFGVMQ